MINNPAITGKTRIFRFPENLVENNMDESGKQVQFVLFEISTSASGSMMGGDVSAPTEQVSDSSSGQLSFADQLPNKPWNQLNRLTVIDTAIALPMPNNHEVLTAVAYDNQFTPSEMQRTADILMNGSLGGKAADAATYVGTSLAAGIINKISNKVLGRDAGLTQEEVLMSQRMAINPRNEVMFKGFDFRSFTFQYSFAPKNAAESAQVREIVRKFRYYSLPEISPTKLFYTFPGIFKIQFMWGEINNDWLPKIGVCVLKSVNVNYSPNSAGWATLPNGDPVQIDMSLNFTEIELVDRNRVDNSGNPDADPAKMGY